MENETELSEYQSYVIKGLIEQERQALGRELSLREQHRIRDDYLIATQKATPLQKRMYRRSRRIKEVTDYTWKPSTPVRHSR
ncbi:DUF3811 domain-containing protein [Hafnia alvei]|uniref:DUF3811 domain-containing protein n=1 Tax=Hafnia alvei TaxID=569 RepID=UPI0024A8266A|nr:DUF3811 domain-containing protein [Hafnia alvei]